MDRRYVLAIALAFGSLCLARDGLAEEAPTPDEATAPAQQAEEAADEAPQEDAPAPAPESPDVFVPSESISEDVSVPFPVDI